MPGSKNAFRINLSEITSLNKKKLTSFPLSFCSKHSARIKKASYYMWGRIFFKKPFSENWTNHRDHLIQFLNFRVEELTARVNDLPNITRQREEASGGTIFVSQILCESMKQTPQLRRILTRPPQTSSLMQPIIALGILSMFCAFP